MLPFFNLTLTELKAGIAAVSVAWHSLACLFIKDIIAAVCSAEFMAQYQRVGHLKPGKTDRVSTITSGLIDNLTHFIRSSSTAGFRLAFVAMVIVTTVGPLGSGIITTGTITSRMEKDIGVAIVNITGLALGMDSVVERANLLMRLEREEDTVFGYNMSSMSDSESVLIPWPSMETDLPEQSSLIYRSDVLRFHHQCAWATNVSYPDSTVLTSTDSDSRDKWAFAFTFRINQTVSSRYP
jgi:hypothetical protein